MTDEVCENERICTPVWDVLGLLKHNTSYKQSINCLSKELPCGTNKHLHNQGFDPLSYKLWSRQNNTWVQTLPKSESVCAAQDPD